MKKRIREKGRETAMILAIAFWIGVTPAVVRAEGSSRVTGELHHVHTGCEEQPGGCYGEPILHEHVGNPSEGGACYGQPVYHIHTGDSGKGGGCYAEKIYHVHIGNEVSGGVCYRTPVYHVHGGSSAQRGGCYTVPVYHVHAGNERSGGNCYRPVYHQHTDSCCREEGCSMEYVGEMRILRTFDAYCSHHGNTQHAVIEAKFKHSACGAGTARGTKTVCWACQNFSGSHDYKKLVCRKSADTVEGYELSCTKTHETVDSWALGCGKSGQTIEGYQCSCGKNEQTIDGYKRSCGKDETTIDCYALSCKKTEETIDGYQRNCGRDEETVYAYLTLTNENTSWTSDHTILSASLEETGSDAFLSGAEVSFLWEGALSAGGKSMEGEQKHRLEVQENGLYTLALKVENDNIAERDLQLSMEVKNIDKTPPSVREVNYEREQTVSANVISVKAEDIQPDGSSGSGLAEEPYSYDGGTTWCATKEKLVTQNETVPIWVRDVCGNIAKAEASIDNIEIPEPEPPSEPEIPPQPEPEPPSEPEIPPQPEPEPPSEPEIPSQPEPEPPSEPEIPSQPESEPPSEPDIPPQPEPEPPSEPETPSESGDETQPESEPPSEPETPPQSEPPSEPETPQEPEALPDPQSPSQPEKRDKKSMEEKKVNVIVPKKEKKTEAVAAKPRTAAAVAAEPIKTVERKSIAEPVIKAISFTLGSLAGTAGLFWLLYLLSQSIRVYHNDSEGKRHYAGSCLVKREGESFEVSIPRRMLEQSATGQYTLCPSIFLVQKKKGSELIVITDEGRQAVWMDKEISLRLPSYAR